MLMLSESDVRQLLPIEECVDVLEAAFREWADGGVSNMPRYRLPLARGAQQVMAGGSDALGAAGLKTYVTGTGGPSRMLVVLFGAEDGQPLALIEANALGQIRTGAASGLATRYMAREDARTVGIVGAGYQAQTQLAAVCAVRPIERALVYSRTPERRDAFAERMSADLDVAVRPVDSSAAAVAEADVVCTITNSREPVVAGAALGAGTHVNAAGSNHWMRREVDEAAIRRSSPVVVDDLANAKNECGELIWAVERRAFRWERAVELRDVVSGRVPGRPSPDAVTLFESQGLAVEDVAAGMHVYRKALASGLGRSVGT